MKFYLTLYITAFCLLVTDFAAFGQGKRIEIVGGDLKKKEMIFVAEIHSIEERGAFNRAVRDYVWENSGINNFVIEAGNAYAYLVNKYINEGDTSLFMYVTDSSARENMVLLKSKNESMPANKKIRVFGMDFERMEFVVAAKKILKGNETTVLFKHLASIPDSLCLKTHMSKEQNQMRLKVYHEARQMFRNEKVALKSLVKADYDVLELIFENPTTEKKFARRDKGMYRNITKQLKGAPFVCITGRYHTEFTRYQVYPSMIKKFVRGHRGNAKKMVIIDEVRNGRFKVMRLFNHDGDPDEYGYGTAGPKYFIRNDSAMALGFSKYHNPCCFTLVHKSIFKDLVKKDNHGLDSYYVFFGEAPKGRD